MVGEHSFLVYTERRMENISFVSVKHMHHLDTLQIKVIIVPQNNYPIVELRFLPMTGCPKLAFLIVDVVKSAQKRKR